MAHTSWRAGTATTLLCMMLAGCTSAGETDEAPVAVEASALASTVPSELPTNEAPDSTERAATSTPLDAELACLSEALASHPELLSYLDGSADPADAEPIDALRALLVARTCMPDEVLNEMVADALGAQVNEPLSGFQVACLTDLLLSLPDEDLAALLDVAPDADATTQATTGSEVAARMLRLCGIERS